MPDVILHNKIGDGIYNKLLVDLDISVDSEIFRFGLLGPDPYIYYRFFAPHFHHGVNRRSYLMHNTKTGDFLINLAKKATTDEEFSYLAGFLCHYALDSTCHPFVNELAGFDDNLHRAIEHRLDLIEMQRTGKSLFDRPISKILPSFPNENMKHFIDGSMKEIYGLDNCWQILRTSYKHMKVFYWIIQDPHGRFDLVIRHTVKKAKWLSYRSHICDNMDLSRFDDLFVQAENDGISFVHGAYLFYKGKIGEQDLKKTIGNRSYVTG